MYMEENMPMEQDKHAGLSNLKALFTYACGTVELILLTKYASITSSNRRTRTLRRADDNLQKPLGFKINL